MLTETRVVLSTGADPVSPRPAALFVSVKLGHVFRALSLDEQRRMIEDALGEALGLAIEKVEDDHVAQARAHAGVAA